MNASLRNAVRAAIAHGNTLADIKPLAWAATYHCDVEAIRDAWELALSEQALPANSFEVVD